MLVFNRGRFNRLSSPNLKSESSIILLGSAKDFAVSRDFAGDVQLRANADGAVHKSASFAGSAKINTQTTSTLVRARDIGELFKTRQNSKFNIMAFNRGKFSAGEHIRSRAFARLAAGGKLTAVRGFFGDAALDFLATSGPLNKTSTFRGDAALGVLASGLLNANRAFEGQSLIFANASGILNLILAFDGDALMRLMASRADFNTFRTEYIHLPNVILSPGSELAIDIENMTISINGENAIRFLSRSSEFFSFNPSENEIRYTANGQNANTAMRILWKDAWL